MGANGGLILYGKTLLRRMSMKLKPRIIVSEQFTGSSRRCRFGGEAEASGGLLSRQFPELLVGNLH